MRLIRFELPWSVNCLKIRWKSLFNQPEGISMFRNIKITQITLCITMVMGLSACSTLTSAYESVSTTVSDAFKSDDAKK